MAVLLALAKLIHLKDILYFPLQKSVKRFEAALMLAPEQSTQVEVRSQNFGIFFASFEKSGFLQPQRLSLNCSWRCILRVVVCGT